MFEVAARIRELASSNLSHLVEKAGNPEKMLRLLQLELEEAIIALERDAAGAERRARDADTAAGSHDKAAQDWHDKARLALTKDREDLARGALDERQRAQESAATHRESGKSAGAEAAALREAVKDLEAKLAETRTRLRATKAVAASAAPSAAAPASKLDRMNDRIATLEKRIDFAQAEAGASAKAARLDEELAAMKREAALDDELAALRKALKKGK